MVQTLVHLMNSGPNAGPRVVQTLVHPGPNAGPGFYFRRGGHDRPCPTDWTRAEDLFGAFTSHVGIPGCILWPHQASAILRLRDAFEDGARRIMLQAATGAGKTRIASTIISGVCDIGRPVLFVVPAIELIDQTLAKFFAEGIHDVGVIQADHMMTNRDRPVQIASVQTLMRRELPPSDLVFIDEAHRWFDFYGTGCSIWNGAMFRSSGCRPRHGRRAWAATTTS